MTSPENRIFERYLGSLLGAAVGNALGLPVEGFPADKIQRRFGHLSDILFDNFGINGFTDDDTEMMLAIAESYVELGSCDIDDITRRFIKWFIEDAHGIGIRTSKVLSKIAGGEDAFKASFDVWESGGKTSAGNGGLMRCVSTSLARINMPEKLDEESRLISRITHYDPRSTESCIFFNRFVAAIIKSEDDDPLKYLYDLQSQEVVEYARSASRISKKDLKVGGYVLDTLSVAVWGYLNFNNFEEALIEIINLGGDTDTNGAVLGALMGAKYGYQSIPERWLEHLGNTDRIENAARGLFDLGYRD